MTPARVDVNIAIQEFAKQFKPGQKVLFVGVDPKWDYKNLFTCTYETMDILKSRHPNIIGDIQSCSQIKDNSYDGVIMTGVYEYLLEPHKAMDEIYRILKKGGNLLFCAPGYGYYGDKKPIITALDMTDWVDRFRINQIRITFYKNNNPYYFQIFATK